MSVKIYDGLKYKYRNLEDVGKFHRKLINVAQEQYAIMYNQKVAAFTLDVILTIIAFHNKDLDFYLKRTIAQHFYCFNDEAVSDHISERVLANVNNDLDKFTWEDDEIQSIFQLIKSIATTINYLFVTDTIFKNVIEVRISLYYQDDYVLFIPFDDSESSRQSSNGLLFQRLSKITGVEEYHYQNSCDKPDDIKESDWEKRHKEWEQATTSFQQSMNFSNCSNVLVNSPNQTNVIPIMYTTNKEVSPYYEVTKEFIDMIKNRYSVAIDSTFKSIMESRIDTSSIQGNGWMAAYKYMVRTVGTMVKTHENEYNELKKVCDSSFIPLFNYFECES